MLPGYHQHRRLGTRPRSSPESFRDPPGTPGRPSPRSSPSRDRREIRHRPNRPAPENQLPIPQITKPLHPLPALIRPGTDRPEPPSRPLARHPRRHRLPPRPVVPGLLVGPHRLIRSVHLIKKKMTRIVLGLENIESQIARLQASFLMIDLRGPPEVFLPPLNDMNINAVNNHRGDYTLGRGAGVRGGGKAVYSVPNLVYGPWRREKLPFLGISRA